MSTSQSSRSRVRRLSRRGWMLLMVAAVCLITGYATARTELMYIAAFTALLPAAAIIYVRMRQPRLETRRDFQPTVISAGQTATATLQVRNKAAAPTPQLRWSELLPWAPHQTPVETLAPIPPRRTVAARYTLQPPRRGIMYVGPMTIEFSDPFSLAHVWRTIAQPERIVVTPALVVLPDIGLALAEGDGAAQLIQRRAAGNDDDLMTREYRAGDALRRVHWRASARQGELMVRQEEQRTFPEARIIIDTLRGGYDDPLFGSGQPVESDRFEWAVSMLASLGVHLHAAGYRVHIVETGARQVAPLGDAHEWAASDSEFLISLAEIHLVREREGVGYASDEQPGARGPVFALISEPSDDTLDWLIAQRRPFDLALAFVLDGWSDTTAQALTNAGWHCIEVSPEVPLADAWTTALVETGGVHGLV